MLCMLYMLQMIFLSLSFALDVVYLTVQPQTRRNLYLPHGASVTTSRMKAGLPCREISTAQREDKMMLMQPSFEKELC